MHSLNLRQRGITHAEQTQQNYGKVHRETWTYDNHSHRTYFTSDFDISCTTIEGSVGQQHTHCPDPYKRNKRLFTAWVVKLNSSNQLVVEGSLECGRRARSKPIAERLCSSKILSKSKHLYYLVGNMADSQYELPGFVRHRFHAGFPEDWQIVIGIWKSFITLGSEAGIRLSSLPDDLVVEKKLKLAIGSCLDSDCFMECAQKVNGVDYNSERQEHSADRNRIKEYNKRSQETRIFESGNGRIGKYIVDYESQDDEKSTNCNTTINHVKRITGWTPFVASDENLKHCLLFRGTLLSSMGQAVNKNHMTDAVHGRLSPRIIETINNEFYELIGDVNNAKRDIPKELVTWCRYGCPKRIHLFCEKWKILKNDEGTFNTGQFKTGRTEQTSLEICQENSKDSIISQQINSSLIIQPTRKKNKRKRVPIEINDDHSASDTSIQDNYTTHNEEGGAILINDSRVESLAQVRRKRQTRRPRTRQKDINIAEDRNLKMISQVHSTVTHQEDKPHPSPLQNKIVPLLSYVYHRCAPPTDNVLSDGV